MTNPSDQSRRHLPAWAPYDWSGADADRISEGLKKRRARIAQLLNIDLEDVEGRRVISEVELRAFAAIVSPGEKIRAIRHGGDVKLVPVIDVALEEIASASMECCAAIRNEQDLASSAMLYRMLQQVSGREAITEQEIERLDPKVRSLIASHYPVDRGEFAPGHVQAGMVREAARAALETLDPPKRGRPKGTQTPLQPFIEGLVGIYDSWAIKSAGRSVKVNRAGRCHAEQGRFLEFCEIVFGALPDWARPKLLKSGGTLASAVRQALKVKRDREAGAATVN